jgi:hypothetical protein
MKTVRIVLCPQERDLILKHGYSFEELESALRAAKHLKEPIPVDIDPFYLEHLLGELARSINHSRSDQLVDRLNDLYEHLGEASASGVDKVGEQPFG